MDQSLNNISSLLSELTEIGIALSSEKDHNRLLELILVKAMDITNSDGGTLYISNKNSLEFEILHNRSLGIHIGGTSGKEISLPSISLFDAKGNKNNQMVAAHAVNSEKTINIKDAYTNTDFDFSGTRTFDKKMGYRSTSFLTVPMANHEHDIIGVLQLINSIDKTTNEIVAFSALDQQLIESLASQAAVTITNQTLIESQRKLFDSFIQLIATAIDEKSPYTAGHCRRVPAITEMLANATNEINKGPLGNFFMSDTEMYELSVAAWLHDCGKITTPEYVVDKATKLETIFDRINLVHTRFEILKRDAVIDALKLILKKDMNYDDIDQALKEDASLQSMLVELEKEKKEIEKYNIGGESLLDFDKKRIQEISKRKYKDSGHNKIPLLNSEEVENLKISRGTLNDTERQIINNHVTVTIKMLESLPYPKHLKNVPEFAGCHHEKMDGTGYPNQLNGEQMSIPARMIAIADIFEALTAGDRPYKKGMLLSQALKILGRMKVEKHIDPDLFDVFMNQKIYLKYANEYLSKDQIDEINLRDIPGYEPLIDK
jgi:HD-GYP domain-containing protein (c-di-GMP phosphodiesterase class II)